MCIPNFYVKVRLHWVACITCKYRAPFQHKNIFPGIGISTIKIRWSWDRLPYKMWMAILRKRKIVPCLFCTCTCHDDVMKWKHFPRYWSFVRGIHRSPVNPPHKGPVTRSFDVLFDLRLNKRLSKQSWGWWFETPSHPLWRHRNVKYHHSHNEPMASQITGVSIVCWDQRKHQRSASLDFCEGNTRWPVVPLTKAQ